MPGTKSAKSAWHSAADTWRSRSARTGLQYIPRLFCCGAPVSPRRPAPPRRADAGRAAGEPVAGGSNGAVRAACVRRRGGKGRLYRRGVRRREPGERDEGGHPDPAGHDGRQGCRGAIDAASSAPLRQRPAPPAILFSRRPFTHPLLLVQPLQTEAGLRHKDASVYNVDLNGQ